jgi:hypothetical protein
LAITLNLNATGQQPAAVPADEAAAVTQFNTAIADYMAFRNRLRNEVRGPVPASTAVELTQASDALAAAIQRARSGAKPGSILGTPIAVMIKRRIDDVVRHDNLGPVLANIDDEEPSLKTPAVHLRFPAASQMATMPPSMLAALPPLPKELEYRIVGTYLVLRDVDAALILDYIPAAVPRKP